MSFIPYCPMEIGTVYTVVPMLLGLLFALVAMSTDDYNSLSYALISGNGPAL
jgi:hypothetical protein